MPVNSLDRSYEIKSKNFAYKDAYNMPIDTYSVVLLKEVWPHATYIQTHHTSKLWKMKKFLMFITTVAFLSLSFINGVNGKSQAELGTIHILRKHL